MSATLAHLLQRFDGAFLVPLTNLGGTLSKSPRALYHMHAKGHLPFRARRIGANLMVSLADVAAWIDNPDAANEPASPAAGGSAMRLRGRPTAMERAEATRLGLSIGDLRRLRAGGVSA